MTRAPRHGTRHRRSGMTLRSRAWIGALASVMLLGAVAAGAEEGASRDTAAPPRRPSVRDSPGWYPSVDPESMSVVIGRRLNAPRVNRLFRGGTRSLDDLGRRVCRALHHDDLDSLAMLCVTEDEFRDILWPEFPQSRPATGLTWQDGWSSLSLRLRGGCRGAIADFGGSYYEFLRFEGPDSTARYRNFKLYSRLVLVARRDTGEIQRFTWLRSVAERRGLFKIYSTND
jgi:hypothetical protein